MGVERVPDRDYTDNMKKIATEGSHRHVASTVESLRRNAGITQKQLAKRAGVGIRFVRELEGGEKRTTRMDKVNQVLAVFDSHLEVVEDRDPRLLNPREHIPAGDNLNSGKFVQAAVTRRALGELG
jgi:transcriptional regulator with XRE-family HTH domain